MELLAPVPAAAAAALEALARAFFDPMCGRWPGSSGHSAREGKVGSQTLRNSRVEHPRPFVRLRGALFDDEGSPVSGMDHFTHQVRLRAAPAVHDMLAGAGAAKASGT